MEPLDLPALAARPVVADPFPHLVLPGFLRAEAADAVRADFPAIAHAGLLPPDQLVFGPAFAGLLDALTGPAMARILGEKFGLDLGCCARMVGVRGRARARDGRIHTDTADKLVTVLLYLNQGWEPGGGRLRLLRGPDDLGDYAAEVAPDCGTLVAFRVGERSWHGHHPFEGERRSVMVNWMRSPAAAGRETARHRLSARVKRLLGAAA